MKKLSVLSACFLIMFVLLACVQFLPLGHAPATGWSVSLTSSEQGKADVSIFGVNPSATDGFDTAYDQVDPPSPPTGVVSYFWYPSNPTSPVDLRKLSTSIIAPSNLMTWAFIVKPVSLSGGTMEINWTHTDTDTIPSDYSVLLLSGTTTVANMRLATDFFFSAASDTEYPFTVKVEQQPVEFGLLVQVSGSGSTNDTGTHFYSSGTVVSVLASPSGGWQLDRWLLNGSDVGAANPYALTMNANYNLTVVFSMIPPVQWRLTVVSAHDSPSPAVGDHLYGDGASVTCSVTSPVVEGMVSYTCTGWTGTGSVPASGSGTSTAFDMGQNSTITWNWQRAPTIEGCDSSGMRRDAFDLDETVNVTGSGYAASHTYSICVVNDTNWSDGMTIPERVQGTATTVSSNISGNINPTVAWNKYLTAGKYDIVVDVNANGKYDVGVDALCDNRIRATAGFLIVPEYIVGTALGLVGCFVALGAFRVYKRRS